MDNDNDRDTIERRSVSMYPAEWAVVDAKAQELDGNVSLTMRLIVREWEDLQEVLKPQRAATAIDGR